MKTATRALFVALWTYIALSCLALIWRLPWG